MTERRWHWHTQSYSDTMMRDLAEAMDRQLEEFGKRAARMLLGDTPQPQFVVNRAAYEIKVVPMDDEDEEEP